MDSFFKRYNENGWIANKVERIVNEEIFVQEHSCEFSSLSERELEVLTLIAKGYTNKGISDLLYISMETVKQHRKHIKKKIGVKNVVEIVKYAQAFDLI